MRLRKPGSRVSKPSISSARERAEARLARKRSATPKPDARRAVARDRYSGAAASFGGVARRSGAELLGIAREVVRIPTAFYMRAAELAGAYALRAWRFAWPVLVAAWRLAARGLAVAQRTLTPARVTAGVALLTAVALAASQWSDLSGIRVGAEGYIGLEGVAPAPQVSEKSVGGAHAWAGLPLALLAAVIVAGSFSGRPRLAYGLIPIGAAVIAISLLVDRPEGLDKGTEAIAYESVTAELLAGFWAQLMSGGVLILIAPVLVYVLRKQRTESPTRAPGQARRRPSPRLRRTAEAGR